MKANQLNQRESPQKTEEPDDKILAQKLEHLSKAIERTVPPAHVLMSRSFIQGLFFALGTTVGVSIVLGLVTFIISELKLIPIISDIIKQMQVEQYIPER